MLEFTHEYFEDEVRDGFFVNSIMKKCWAAQLEVLSDVDRICKRYDIDWFADCGTLLGAVRHGGFVPWDDDLDICMFRDDYYKFLSIASRELTNMWPEYKVLNYHNGEYWEPISRIVNTDNISFSNVRLDKFHGYPFVAGIDIFPLDFVCADKESEEARKQLFGTVFDLADSDFVETVDKRMLEDLALVVGKKYDSSKSAKLQLYEWGEIVSSLYRREEAKEVCLMHFWYKNNDHVYPMELFDKTIKIPFENTMIRVPAGYDQVLKIEYGDYMKLVRTGGIHEYPHYEEQMKKTTEWLREKSPFLRSITQDSVLSIPRENGNDNPRCKVADSCIGTIKLLYEAHDELSKLIYNDQENELAELLFQCQDAAIQLGTYIESEFGEGFVTVKHLEDYCENVYQLSQIINAEGDSKLLEEDRIESANKLLGVMNSQLSVIENSINTDIKALKEVVLMPFKAKYWSVLENVWINLKEDPYVKVIVMPIPYYEKNALGEVKEEFYNIEEYPDYVPLTDYRTYSFEKRKPDQIIIQYPYDNDNFVTTIDSVFYAKNLKKYTDELVYIPYFKTEEIGPGEERAYKVMDNYVLSPAVIYSDKIIVQSEKIKDLYVKKLVEFFGEETRERWEKSIDGSGASLYVESKLAKENVEMPKDWHNIIFKSDGKAKKIVIYNTSISGLFQYKDKMIGKMESVFETFKRNSSEVALIWHPDPLINATIPTTHPELFERYEKLVAQYKSDGFGIYDDSFDKDRLLLLADAYYGDTDKLVQEFRNRNLPVMIQNVEVLDQ